MHFVMQILDAKALKLNTKKKQKQRKPIFKTETNLDDGQQEMKIIKVRNSEYFILDFIHTLYKKHQTYILMLHSHHHKQNK